MPARSGTHGAFAGCRRPLQCSEQSHRLSGRRAGVTAGPARLPGTAEPLPETRKPRACTRGSRASFTTAESGSGPKSAERCTGKENVAPANTGASLSHDRAGTRDAPPRRPHREPGPGARAWIRNARLPRMPGPRCIYWSPRASRRLRIWACASPGRAHRLRGSNASTPQRPRLRLWSRPLRSSSFYVSHLR